MAKKKKGRKRQGLFSKAINIGLTALAFARPLELILSASGRGAFSETAKVIIREASFGLSDGAFNLETGLRMYAPVGAALGLHELKKFASKHFPTR